MNISKGASNTASTSAGFGVGLKAFLLVRMPITGITLRRCCKEKQPLLKLKKIDNISLIFCDI
jgi:hypothetical protein